MSELLDDQTAFQGLTVTEDGMASLDTTRKWGMFLGILGLIGSGLMALGGISVSTVMAMSDRMLGSAFPFPTWILGLFYLVAAVMYFVPSLMLVQFCVKTGKAVRMRSTIDLTAALRKLKQLFMFTGIMTIVLIALYFVMIIGIAVFAASQATAF